MSPDFHYLFPLKLSRYSFRFLDTDIDIHMPGNLSPLGSVISEKSSMYVIGMQCSNVSLKCSISEVQISLYPTPSHPQLFPCIR